MKQLLILLGLIFLFSCENTNTYTLHEKGFEYKFFNQNEDAPKPKVGDVMVLNMTYYYNEDSLLFSSEELSTPFRMKLKRIKPIGETIDDAMSLLHIGDSASFRVNASLFYAQTKQQRVPNKVNQNDKITFYVKLIKVIDKKQFQKEQSKKQVPDTPKKEQQLLKRYIKMSNIKVEPTNSGLYFIEDLKGKGTKPVTGSRVTVNYSGYFIDGRSFSSTYDMGKPFTFTLGKDELIAGFQEGVYMMQKKGHYTLIIPSYLGYGKKGNERIPANKTLIFDIDVLDIK